MQNIELLLYCYEVIHQSCFFYFVLSRVDLYGFKPLEDEDVSTSFSHVFQRLGVSADENVDLQTRVERQVTLAREWGRFLQAHGSADGALPNSVSARLCMYSTYMPVQFAVRAQCS